MDISKLSKCGTVRNYNKGDVIVQVGYPGETAFLVLKGNVDVLLGGIINKARQVATIPAGAFFGEMSLLENDARSATVVAAEDGVMLLEFGESDFMNLMKTDPELAFNMLRTLFNRIESTMETGARHLIAYNAEIRRNKFYKEIGALNPHQFTVIVNKQEEYAITLLKYLSHTLAELNRELMRRVNG